MDVKEIAERIPHCLLIHQNRYKRRLKKIRHGGHTAQLQKLARAVDYSARLRERRQAMLPVPRYPLELPVLEKKQSIKDCIERHQVVVIAGETGSGKSTQIPKFCLELGRGVGGMIGHTQPRRLAARSVASRLAEELDTEVGDAVGFKVRFSEETGDQTFVKLMTDGILLAELEHDPMLLAYDTIIVDEAHERTLNIDFLLGYIKRLLPQRPDLKLIITSATIDTDKFSRFFDDAPVLEVSGRTYPVDIRYRAPEGFDEEDPDFNEAIGQAVQELSRENSEGDILVFLSGEGEIREAMEVLQKRFGQIWEILPLYARLSMGQQQAIFLPGSRRRIILSTNVAETSLTVPRIHYVIDAGFARISRFSHRSKVQRLPIEKISQSSANQRAGRCGRIAPGICLRLYTEDDFVNRPAFTEPEITRSNLASVILKMLSFGIVDVEGFDFVDRPDRKLIKAGLRQLHALAALDDEHRLTPLGRKLARFPVDPQIGAMVLAGARWQSLTEVLIIGSALSVQDIRERPVEHRQKADEKHAAFKQPDSDFLSFVQIWESLKSQQKALSVRKFKNDCHERFLSYRRFREWQDIHKQLKSLCRDLDLRFNKQPARYQEVHRALLAGLLGNIALKTDKHEFTGAGGVKLHIFPGSGLFKKPPQWIVAAELIETTKLYAHTVAKIQPDWVEEAAPHLVKRQYLEPHWEKRPAQVAAYEQVSLYGLILVARRKVNYGPIDPVTARDIFIRRALVDQDYDCRGAFFKHNKKLMDEIEAMEDKTRRKDYLVEPEVIYGYYDQRIPHHVYSGKAFEKWRAKVEKQQPDLLFLEKQQLLKKAATSETDLLYPNRFPLPEGLGQLKLDYYFEPGHPRDGVTVTVPINLLNQLQPGWFECLVPGLLKEKVELLLRSLPKAQRKQLVPIPQTVERWMESVNWPLFHFHTWLKQQLQKSLGEFDQDLSKVTLDQHFQMNFKVVDPKGAYLDLGRDLKVLINQWGGFKTDQQETALRWPQEQEDVRGGTWHLDHDVQLEHHGAVYYGYPGLYRHGEKVGIRVYDNREKAREGHHQGLIGLLRWALKPQLADVRKRIVGNKPFMLLLNLIGLQQNQVADLEEAILIRVFMNDAIRSSEALNDSIDKHKAMVVPDTEAYIAVLVSALEHFRTVKRMIKNPSPAWLRLSADILDQLNHLFYPGFMADARWEWMQCYPRYTEGLVKRLEKARDNLQRDHQHMQALTALWKPFWDKLNNKRLSAVPEDFQQYRWELEELRVSLFAQELKTKVSVSLERLQKKWQTLKTQPV